MKHHTPNNYDLFFCVPLEVKVSKNKTFILNQNKYRNAHFRVLSRAKEEFNAFVKKLNIEHDTFENPIRVHYVYYPKSKRIYDRMNVACVIDKFLMDALQLEKIIKDDNYNTVLFPTFVHGEVDREYPRCEVYIEEIK